MSLSSNPAFSLWLEATQRIVRNVFGSPHLKKRVEDLAVFLESTSPQHVVKDFLWKDAGISFGLLKLLPRFSNLWVALFKEVFLHLEQIPLAKLVEAIDVSRKNFRTKTLGETFGRMVGLMLFLLREDAFRSSDMKSTLSPGELFIKDFQGGFSLGYQQAIKRWSSVQHPPEASWQDASLGNALAQIVVLSAAEWERVLVAHALDIATLGEQLEKVLSNHPQLVQSLMPILGLFQKALQDPCG